MSERQQNINTNQSRLSRIIRSKPFLYSTSATIMGTVAGVAIMGGGQANAEKYNPFLDNGNPSHTLQIKEVKTTHSSEARTIEAKKTIKVVIEQRGESLTEATARVTGNTVLDAFKILKENGLEKNNLVYVHDEFNVDVSGEIKTADTSVAPESTQVNTGPSTESSSVTQESDQSNANADSASSTETTNTDESPIAQEATQTPDNPQTSADVNAADVQEPTVEPTNTQEPTASPTDIASTKKKNKASAGTQNTKAASTSNTTATSTTESLSSTATGTPSPDISATSTSENSQTVSPTNTPDSIVTFTPTPDNSTTATSTSTPSSTATSVVTFTSTPDNTQTPTATGTAQAECFITDRKVQIKFDGDSKKHKSGNPVKAHLQNVGAEGCPADFYADVFGSTQTVTEGAGWLESQHLISQTKFIVEPGKEKDVEVEVIPGEFCQTQIDFLRQPLVDATKLNGDVMMDFAFVKGNEACFTTATATPTITFTPTSTRTPKPTNTPETPTNTPTNTAIPTNTPKPRIVVMRPPNTGSGPDNSNRKNMLIWAAMAATASIASFGAARRAGRSRGMLTNSLATNLDLDKFDTLEDNIRGNSATGQS